MCSVMSQPLKGRTYKQMIHGRCLLASLTLLGASHGTPTAGGGPTPVDFTAGAYLKPLPNITVYSSAVPLVFRWDFDPASQLHHLRAMVGRTCQSTDRRPICSLPRAIVEGALRDWDRRNWLEPVYEAPLDTDGGPITNAFALPGRRHAKRMMISAAEAEALEVQLMDVGGVRNLSAPCFPAYTPAGGPAPDWGLFSLVSATIAAQMDVLKMCQSRRLNPNVIDVETLRAELLTLQETVQPRGWDLAIRHFSRYYILALVDCLLSPTSLYLFLVLPLNEVHSTSVSLHSFVPIPFAYDDYTCQIKAPTTELALIRTPDGVQLGYLQCNPYRDELCLLEPALDTATTPMQCAKRVASGGTAAEVASECPLECVRTTETRIVRLGPSTFLVAHPPRDAVVHCDQAQWSDWGAERKGSFQITLPCGCRLYIHGRNVTHGFPCIPSSSPSLSIRRLIPAAWASLLSLHLPPFSLAHSSSCMDLRECTSSSWTPKKEETSQFQPWIIAVIFVIIVVSWFPSLFLILRFYLDCSHPPDPFYLRASVPPRLDRPPTPPTMSPTREHPPALPPTNAPRPPNSFRRPPVSLAASVPIYETISEEIYLPMRTRPSRR